MKGTNSIFPNYMANGMKQRRGSREVLQKQIEKEICDLLGFPAKLNIHYQGQVKAINDPVEAKSFVNQKH